MCCPHILHSRCALQKHHFPALGDYTASYSRHDKCLNLVLRGKKKKGTQKQNSTNQQQKHILIIFQSVCSIYKRIFRNHPGVIQMGFKQCLDLLTDS